MKRLFGKSHDRPARPSLNRARDRRRQPGLESLEGRQLLSLASQDFLVNVSTPRSQFFSDNATRADGVSVAVWGTNFGPGDNDIHAQLYNANGSRRGDEITVENSKANQQNPKVGIDNAGTFVVFWEELSNGQSDIVGRQFNITSTGASASGDRIILAADQGKNEHDEDVAMDSNGDYVVSYTNDFNDHDQDVQAFRFNKATGTFAGITVANSSLSDEQRSSVAMSPDGRFDIAYQVVLHSGGGARPNLARYQADRSVLSNGPLLQSNRFFIAGKNPNVSMDNDGNAVVVYDHDTTGGPGGGAPPPHVVEAIRVSSTGNMSDVKEVGFGHARLASVALRPTGGSYVVGYVDDLAGVPGNTTVEVTEVSGSDIRGTVVNLPAFPNNAAPAVSIAPNGSYLLTFTAGVGGTDQDIHGRRGFLSSAPAAKNLTLTPATIHAGQSAILKGQLTDADADPKLKLSVTWGDGSPVQKSQPGLKPFTLAHRYARAGTYSVRVTWTDSTGLSNSKVLKVKVLA